MLLFIETACAKQQAYLARGFLGVLGVLGCSSLSINSALAHSSTAFLIFLAASSFSALDCKVPGDPLLVLVEVLVLPLLLCVTVTAGDLFPLLGVCGVTGDMPGEGGE